MFSKNKLQFAILFRRMTFDFIDFPIFFPDGAIIGKLSADRMVFNDYLSGRKYLSTDISNVYGLSYGFNMAQDVRDIKEVMGIRNLGDALRGYAGEMERQICFYDENYEFVALSISQFEKKYEVKLPIWNTVYNRALIDDIIDEDISVDDIKDKYSSINSKESIETNDKIKTLLNTPISEIVNKIKETIIAQDDVIKELITAIYKHLSSEDPNLKSNILICGPSGTGKTAIIEELGKIIGIPVWIEDMTRFTASGYVGSSAIDILTDLYINAGNNIKLAEKSILFLDEIDKKSYKGKRDSDFNKKDVLNDLLKIIEGGIFYITLPDKSVIPFDTSRLIVIVGGAFSKLYESRNVDKVIGGFTSSGSSKTIDKKDITLEDLRNYGMSNEFLGRIKYIIKMKKLCVEDLVSIMKSGKKSPIKSYIDYFKNRGIDIIITDEMYERIAKLAFSFGTGARGLNLIVNKIFNNIYYEIFNSSEEIDRIILGENIVEDNNDYKLIRKCDNNG